MLSGAASSGGLFGGGGMGKKRFSEFVIFDLLMLQFVEFHHEVDRHLVVPEVSLVLQLEVRYPQHPRPSSLQN